MPSHRPIWLVAIITLFVYAPVLTNDFVSWDDGDTIYSNPRLNPATFEQNRWYWSHPENGEYLPLTRSVWALLTPVARLTQADDRGITLNPSVYHGISLIAHTISAILVFAILRRILPAGRHWPAAAGALLFALHPLQVESVAWASGLKDLLFGLFALAAILAYLCYASDHNPSQKPQAGRGHASHPGTVNVILDHKMPRTAAAQGLGPRATKLFYILGLLALLASILSKPMGVITPLLVALLGWRFCRRPLRQVMLELVPWFGFSLIFGLLARHWMPATAIPTTALWTRPLIAADSLAFYLFKLIWPAQLAIDYGRTPPVVMSSGWGCFTWLAPAIIAVLLWRIRGKHPLPGLGAALALLAALPILGLMPHMFQYYSTVADHYAYLPMLGVAIAGAYGLSLLRVRTAAVVATCVLAVLGIRSMAQMQNWSSNRQFWKHALSVNPDSYVAMVSLAQQMMGRDADEQVTSRLDRALALNPDYLPTHQALVEFHTLRRRIDPAIVHLRRSLEIMETFPDSQRPDLAPQYLSLAELLLARGRPGEALAAAERARTINPGNPSVPATISRIREATTGPTTLPGHRR